MLTEDLLAILNDPTEMWARALQQLPRDTQRLFLTLALLSPPISVDDLQRAYVAQEFDPENTFLSSLKALDDSFIRIGKRYESGDSLSALLWRAKGVRFVDFWNPTIADFSQSYLDENTDWLPRLLGHPSFTDQLTTVFGLAMTEYDGELKFPNIHRWVRDNSIELLSQLLTLAEPGGLGARVTRPYGSSEATLADIVRIVAWIRQRMPNACVPEFQQYVRAKLSPSSAAEMSTLGYTVYHNPGRNEIEALSGISVFKFLRSHLINVDEWRYAYLVKIDAMLDEIGREESLADWGVTYRSYVDSLVQELENAESKERIIEAISEVTEAMDILGLDLNDQLSDLEDYAENFPPEEDEDYEQESRSEPDDSSEMSSVDALFEGFDRG
jgi:hypothetical protein